MVVGSGDENVGGGDAGFLFDLFANRFYEFLSGPDSIEGDDSGFGVPVV